MYIAVQLSTRKERQTEQIYKGWPNIKLSMKRKEKGI